ncbi:prepilin peptidase [uncultured Algibacter sp.]|uniref:prepilin peptidase n=1 Tax=uncultured Algibacter sp. TaxID=298659 RepID=UPI0032162F89
MPTAILIALIGVLIVVFFQDYRKRTIHAILPITIFLLGLYLNYSSSDLEFIFMIYNIGFVVINITGLVLYFSIKHKAIVNPIDTFIGLGDIVFFIAITPLFSLKPFILFFILGLLFSLLIHGVFTLIKEMKTIPLAGYLSLFLILHIVLKDILKINVPLSWQ